MEVHTDLTKHMNDLQFNYILIPFHIDFTSFECKRLNVVFGFSDFDEMQMI